MPRSEPTNDVSPLGMNPNDMQDVHATGAWLGQLGLPQYAAAFISELVDGDTLLDLVYSDHYEQAREAHNILHWSILCMPG